MSNILRFRERAKCGFTLIELLVTIAILALLIGIVLPGLQRSREIANRFQTMSIARDLCMAIDRYYRATDKFPKDIAELVERGEVPIAPEAIQPDGRAEVNGYLLEFIVDQALIEVHLAFLESLPDGKSLAAQLREQNLEFLVFGRPAEGGRTGCLLFYTDADCNVHEVEDPKCAALRDEMFQNLQRYALKKTAELVLGNPDAADKILPVLAEPETKEVAFDVLDRNSNQEVTFSELRLLASRPGASATENATEPIVALQDFLLFALDEEMKVGAGRERVEHLGVKRTELDGDLTTLLSGRSYGLLIDSVAPDGVATSLTAKVRAAEKARLRWEASDPETRDDEAETCQYIIKAFRNELWAQEGKSIGFEDALLLDAAVEVLCPKVEAPLD